jgi:hypothetical protein
VHQEVKKLNGKIAWGAILSLYFSFLFFFDKFGSVLVVVGTLPKLKFQFFTMILD